MPKNRHQNEQLTVLFLLGLFVFNYPLLALFNKDGLWFGIPSLYLYLFLFWAVFIGLMGLIMELGSRKSSSSRSNDGDRG